MSRLRAWWGLLVCASMIGNRTKSTRECSCAEMLLGSAGGVKQEMLLREHDEQAVRSGDLLSREQRGHVRGLGRDERRLAGQACGRPGWLHGGDRCGVGVGLPVVEEFVDAQGAQP